MRQLAADEARAALWDLEPRIVSVFSRVADAIVLQSLSVVGECVAGRKPEQVMDIDVVAILGTPMTEEKHSIVEESLSEICSQPYHEVGFRYRIADGPMKPDSSDACHIFLHTLLHTVASYRNSPLVLVKNSWQYEARALLGRPVSDFHTISGVDWELVLSGSLGIRHCLKMIESQRTACLVWVPGEGGVLEIESQDVPLTTGIQLLDLSYYSVLRCASNCLKAICMNRAGIGIKEPDMREFSVVFDSLAGSEYPLECVSKKAELRRSQEASEAECADEVSRCVSFLKHLERIVVSRIAAGEH